MCIIHGEYISDVEACLCKLLLWYLTTHKQDVIEHVCNPKIWRGGGRRIRSLGPSWTIWGTVSKTKITRTKVYSGPLRWFNEQRHFLDTKPEDASSIPRTTWLEDSTNPPKVFSNFCALTMAHTIYTHRKLIKMFENLYRRENNWLTRFVAHCCNQPL